MLLRPAAAPGTAASATESGPDPTTATAPPSDCRFAARARTRIVAGDAAKVPQNPECNRSAAGPHHATGIAVGSPHPASARPLLGDRRRWSRPPPQSERRPAYPRKEKRRG